jgi:Iron-containing redox enzyme
MGIATFWSVRFTDAVCLPVPITGDPYGRRRTRTFDRRHLRADPAGPQDRRTRSLPKSVDEPAKRLTDPVRRSHEGSILTHQPLPEPRGPITQQLCACLRGRVRGIGRLPAAGDDPMTGEDSALALHVLYELHYRGFAGVDDQWEWEPSLLAARRRLEDSFEHALVGAIGSPQAGLSVTGVVEGLRALAAGSDGPSLSGYMAGQGTVEELREFAVHRSIYQLKEADPHTWAIPRLAGRSKAALVTIQTDEYGGGDAEGMHATLFARTLRDLGLDPTYGSYLDRVPGVTLATGNLISLFGLHRRWRGALVGHLALFEMCSVVPMGRYRDALLRLGASEAAARFYAEHVAVDAYHELVACDEMAAALVLDEPALAGDVLFGARALGYVERLFATSLLDAWKAGRSSLRRCEAMAMRNG